LDLPCEGGDKEAHPGAQMLQKITEKKKCHKNQKKKIKNRREK